MLIHKMVLCSAAGQKQFVAFFISVYLNVGNISIEQIRVMQSIRRISIGPCSMAIFVFTLQFVIMFINGKLLGFL